jgi:hypothetical protein
LRRKCSGLRKTGGIPGCHRPLCPRGLADELDVDDPQMHARAPALRAIRPRLPRQLAALIDACLEPEPDLRPALDDACRLLRNLA